MNVRKSMTTIAAACALSLVTASALAAPGMRGGAAGAATSHVTAPAKPTTTATTTTARPTTTQKATTTGRPNASCEDLGNQPGNSITAPGSAFNPNGVSGGVYSETSQYDVACARSHSH